MTCSPPVTPANPAFCVDGSRSPASVGLKRLDSGFRRNDGVGISPFGQNFWQWVVRHSRRPVAQPIEHCRNFSGNILAIGVSKLLKSTEPLTDETNWRREKLRRSIHGPLPNYTPEEIMMRRSALIRKPRVESAGYIFVGRAQRRL